MHRSRSPSNMLQNDKTLIMTGLGPRQILEKMQTVPKKRTQTAVHHPGMLDTEQDFDVFWTMLEFNKKMCGQLLEGMLDWLVRACDSKKELPPGLNLTSLLNSIIYLAFFYNYNSRSPQLKYLSQRAAASLKKASRSVFKCIRSLHISEGKMDADKICTLTKNLCTALQSKEDFEIRSSATQAPYESRSGERSFLFAYLYEQARGDPTSLRGVMRSTVKFIGRVPQFLRVNPPATFSLLLSYFQILSSMVTLGARIEQEQLDEAFEKMHQFYYWPKPVGCITKDLLARMERECHLPGQTMRDALSEEAKYAREETRGSVGGGPLQQPAALVWHVIDNVSESTATLSYILRLGAAGSKDHKSAGGHASPLSPPPPPTPPPPKRGLKPGQHSPHMQLVLVVDMLVSFKVPVLPEDLEVLLELEKDDLAMLYSRCRATIAALEEKRAREPLDAEASQSLCAERLGALKRDCLERIQQRKKETSDRAPAPASAKTTIREEMTGVNLNHLLSKGYRLSLPEMRHRAIRCYLQYQFSSDHKSSATVPGNGKLPPLPDMYADIVRAIRGQTDGVVSAHSRKKLTLRFVLMGGDRLMHSFLCAYVRMVLAETSIPMEKLNFEFFVVPTALNHLACFLARHDNWYCHQIYTPFFSDRFLLPWVSVDPKKGSEASKDNVPNRMTRFFASLINNYIYEARQTLNLTVWRCDAYDWNPPWTVGGNKGDKGDDAKRPLPRNLALQRAIKALPTHTFPFFQRIEIGYRAEMARYCQREEARMRQQVALLSRKPEMSRQEAEQLWQLGVELRPDNVETLRKSLEAKFAKEKRQPPELKLRFIKVDLDGKPVKITHEPQYMGFSKLTLTNVPVHDDTDTLPPDPEEPWLEMHARVAPSYASRKSVLNTEPTQHVVRVEVSVRGNDRFSVLVDGQLYPPFDPTEVPSPKSPSAVSSIGYKTLVIDKQCDNSFEQIKFPVRTFFPMI
mmetsp:Transcript_15310/g.31054  ORF Transcript_15310/g.31054 Transcript_15310/m.31054 type:complete len:969 (-) Transcript_15310:247-3153(-)